MEVEDLPRLGEEELEKFKRHLKEKKRSKGYQRRGDNRNIGNFPRGFLMPLLGLVGSKRYGLFCEKSGISLPT